MGASALRFLWTTRLLVIAGNVAMFPLRRARTFDRHPELVTAAYCVMIASGISAMTLAMGGLASEYYAGLSLVIVGAGLLFVWRPATAAITHLLIISSFVSPNLMVHGWPTEGSAFSNLAFLLAIAVVGGIGQVVLYRSQREQVFNQVALEETKANLETAHEQLKQLDRFKSQFFANITHEFKTPLAMILSPLELLLHGEVGEIGPTQRATFEMMFRSGMKLLKMIGDLLDLSKLEESRLRLKISEHDLAEHLRNLCEQVQPLAQRKRIETKLVASGTCLVNCDLERMERVFVNLLSNALKFTREGGHVTVSLHDLGDIAWIVVKDDGPGFPAQMAERLFERFFQVDMGETRRYGGTGIGLALAREIVELHGGRIRAESDHGARFTVELIKDKEHFRPEVLDRRSHRRDVLSGARAGDRGLMDFAAQMQAREEFRLLDIHEATERRALARDPEEDSRRHTCLVVEDTPDVIRLVGMALQQDFKMLSAPDGAQGLEMARKELPSLIVTDLMMPGMDGLELTSRLRDDPTTRHIPIVMLTARGELEDRVAGMDTGVNTYLAKPFSPRELLSSARSLVKTQAAQADILLTQRMDSLESIAGGLAHEINNPAGDLAQAAGRGVGRADGAAGEADARAVRGGGVGHPPHHPHRRADGQLQQGRLRAPAAAPRRVRGRARRGRDRAPRHRAQGAGRAAVRGRGPCGVRARGVQPGAHQPGAERHRGVPGRRHRARRGARTRRGRAAGSQREGQRARHQAGGPRSPVHALLHHQGSGPRDGHGAHHRLARGAKPGRHPGHRQRPGARRVLHAARPALTTRARGGLTPALCKEW